MGVIILNPNPWNIQGFSFGLNVVDPICLDSDPNLNISKIQK